MNSSQNAGEQRNAVPNGEKTHVLNDVLEPVEKEDDSSQKREMVVSGNHVLGAKIHEDSHSSAAIRLNK